MQPNPPRSFRGGRRRITELSFSIKGETPRTQRSGTRMRTRKRETGATRDAGSSTSTCTNMDTNVEPGYTVYVDAEVLPPRAGPVGVEELAARLVDALVGVRAEVVALGLEQVGRQPLAAVAS